jgi:hypothetical protein
MTRARSLFRLAAAAALLALAPSGARAITYGFVDSTTLYPNVGAFIARRPSDGQIFPVCSGTLVGPDLFLTAAHCTLFFEQTLEPRGFTAFVSFDGSIPFGDQTSGATSLLTVTEVITNPNYNQAQSDPGDIGLLRLAAGSTAGILPATLPTLGLLDGLASHNGLKNAVFTPVGFGVQNRIVGGAPPFNEDVNPVPRMYAYSAFNALNKGYLRLSQNPSLGNGGACFGDSGGPNFYTLGGARILAATTVTGDAVCRSTNVVYRLDTASAREFLGQYVALP